MILIVPVTPVYRARMPAPIQHRNLALALLALYLYTLTSVGPLAKLAALAAAWYPTGGSQWVDLVANTWRRDAM